MVLLHSMDARAAAGVTRYSRELAEALRGAGERVRELRARPLEARLGQRRVGGFASMRVQSWLRPLRKRDVLHSTYHYAAHPRCDVATVHDLFPEDHASWLGITPVEVRSMQATTRRLAARGVRFVAVSEATRARLLASYPEVAPDRVDVVPPGIARRFSPAPASAARHAAFPEDAFNVLCVADLNPRKPLDLLLQAALDVDDPALRVVHVGPQTVRRPAWAGQARREAPLAERLGDRLVRLGRIGDDELLSCYRSADLLVLPTLDEGFGFPPLEALSCGTPVAVSDLPVLRESLGDEADYFQDAAALAAVLRSRRGGRQGRDPAARQRRHQWVQHRHGWPRAAQRMLAVYGRVAGG